MMMDMKFNERWPRSERDIELNDNQSVFGKKFNKEIFNMNFDKMKSNQSMK